jgi:hypothetical protein
VDKKKHPKIQYWICDDFENPQNGKWGSEEEQAAWVRRHYKPGDYEYNCYSDLLAKYPERENEHKIKRGCQSVFYPVSEKCPVNVTLWDCIKFLLFRDWKKYKIQYKKSKELYELSEIKVEYNYDSIGEYVPNLIAGFDFSYPDTRLSDEKCWSVIEIEQ